MGRDTALKNKPGKEKKTSKKGGWARQKAVPRANPGHPTPGEKRTARLARLFVGTKTGRKKKKRRKRGDRPEIGKTMGLAGGKKDKNQKRGRGGGKSP